jgi:hypothetical protein
MTADPTSFRGTILVPIKVVTNREPVSFYNGNDNRFLKHIIVI